MLLLGDDFIRIFKDRRLRKKGLSRLPSSVCYINSFNATLQRVTDVGQTDRKRAIPLDRAMHVCCASVARYKLANQLYFFRTQESFGRHRCTDLFNCPLVFFKFSLSLRYCRVSSVRPTKLALVNSFLHVNWHKLASRETLHVSRHIGQNTHVFSTILD